MDHVYLTGPQGSTIDIGSWLRVDAGVDYGAQQIVQQVYAQNAFVDGGAFAYEQAPLRKMTFPMIVASGGIGGNSLDTIEAMLRQIARPGGYLDILPDGTPTAEMVRFDLIGGRVNHAPYSLPMQRIDRRFLTLELDTPPFGYWPTWTTLASVVATLPGVIPINPASVIGDVPADLEIMVLPSSFTPSGFVPANAWMSTDFLSFAVTQGSTPVLISAASMYTSGVGTVAGDIRAAVASTSFSNTFNLTYGSYDLPASYMPGRFRFLAWLRTTPTGIGPIGVLADVVNTTGVANLPIATGNVIATVAPGAASGNSGGQGIYGAFGVVGSSLYQLIDLGVLTLPSIAAPLAAAQTLRLNIISSPSTVASAQMFFGGGALLPVREAGAVTAGLNRTSLGGGVVIDSALRRAGIRAIFAGSTAQIDDALAQYRGGFARFGASANGIAIIPGGRGNPSGLSPDFSKLASYPVFQHAQPRAFTSVRYRPRFSFLKGL